MGLDIEESSMVVRTTTYRAHILVALLGISFFFGIVTAETLNPADYDFLVVHSLSGSTSDLTDYQVKFVIWNTEAESTGENCYLGSHVYQADWDDVRFTNNEDNILPCWIESTNASAAIFWVKVDSIPSIGTQVKIYSGNNEVSGISEGDATFPFFDHFDQASINTTKWILVEGVGATHSISSSIYECHLISDSNAYSTLKSNDTSGYVFGINYTAMGRVKSAHWSGSSNQREAFGWTSTSSGLSYPLFCGEAGVGQKLRNYDGATNSYASISGWSANTYYNVQVHRYPTQSGVQFNNGTEYTNSANYVTANLQLFFTSTTVSGGNNAQVWVDWVAVRKFAAIEPSHSTYLDPSVIADFEGTPLSGETPLEVSFTDLSTGIVTAWNWSFGDNNWSELQNPTHTYFDEGQYTVSLLASNEYTSDSEEKTDYITVTANVTPTPTPTPTPTSNLNAEFSAVPVSGPAPLTVHFLDQSTGGATSWVWTFDYGNIDSNVSFEKNPSFTYTGEGWYTVNLSVSDGSNTAWKLKPHFIYVGNVTVEGIQNSHGETWIRWNWPNNTTYDIYVDGKLKKENDTLGYYYLTGLNPNEKHRIDLFQDGVATATNTVTTDKNSTIAYILVILGIIFALITMKLEDPFKVILVGSLTFLISLYLAANTWGQLGPLSLAGYILMIFSGIWVGRALWKLFQERSRWG